MAGSRHEDRFATAVTHVALLLNVACLVQAQGSNRQRLEFKEPSGTAWIEGSVTAAGVGQPLEGATVRLLAVGAPEISPKSAKTDVSGRFIFPNLPEARYRMFAEKDGYVRAEAGARSPGGMGQAIELRSGQKLTNVTIAILQEAVLRGSVVGQELEPLAGVTVVAIQETHRSGRRQMLGVRSGATDKKGQFTITGLAPGRYYLMANPAAAERNRLRLLATRAAVETLYVHGFYPGAADPEAAVPIDVTAGLDLAGLEVSLHRDDAVRVSGRVLYGGNAAVGASVSIFPADAPDFASVSRRTTVVQDAAGRFQFDTIRPGAYILTADVIDRESRWFAREQLTVGRTDVQVDLSVSQAMPLRGRVRLDRGDERTAVSSGTVELEALEPSPMRTLKGPIEKDGSFELSNVAAGPFLVRVSGIPDGLYVQSVRLGNREYPDMSLDLSGPTTVPLEITLSSSGGRVSGTVMDQGRQPVKQAIVVLMPDKERRHLMHLRRKVNTDQQGAFEIAGTAPGRYSVLAFDGAQEDKVDDPAFLLQVEKTGVTVDVRSNGSHIVEVRVPGLE
jgi:protocatechuate 3,4-dioxygenase beta subunit